MGGFNEMSGRGALTFASDDEKSSTELSRSNAAAALALSPAVANNKKDDKSAGGPASHSVEVKTDDKTAAEEAGKESAFKGMYKVEKTSETEIDMSEMPEGRLGFGPHRNSVVLTKDEMDEKLNRRRESDFKGVCKENKTATTEIDMNEMPEGRLGFGPHRNSFEILRGKSDKDGSKSTLLTRYSKGIVKRPKLYLLVSVTCEFI